MLLESKTELEKNNVIKHDVNFFFLAIEFGNL